MPMPERFDNKDELVGEVLQHYRAHTRELSGPTAACSILWPTLRRRLSAAMRDELALIGLAHLVQRHATNGSSPAEGWNAQQSSLELTRFTAAGSETMAVPVERLAYNGPTELYPTLLVNTIYATEDGAKPLILFTIHDFGFVNEHLETQQLGLARRQAALRYGARMLQQHGVRVVAELPPEVLGLFEVRWKQALQPLVKKKARSAA